MAGVSNGAWQNESFYFTAEQTRRSQRRGFFQVSGTNRVSGVSFERSERGKGKREKVEGGGRERLDEANNLPALPRARREIVPRFSAAGKIVDA